MDAAALEYNYTVTAPTGLLEPGHTCEIDTAINSEGRVNGDSLFATTNTSVPVIPDVPFLWKRQQRCESISTTLP